MIGASLNAAGLLPVRPARPLRQGVLRGGRGGQPAPHVDQLMALAFLKYGPFHSKKK